MLQGYQLSREKGTPQRKAAFCYIPSKKKQKKPKTPNILHPKKLHFSAFFTGFLPSFPTFHCTLITDAFDELHAGSMSKVQMKAIFSWAICQRKSQGKKKQKHALAKASALLDLCRGRQEDGTRKICIKQRCLKAFITLVLEVWQKGSKIAARDPENTSFSSCSISTAVITLPYTFTESLRIISICTFPLTVLNTYFRNIFNKSEQQKQNKANPKPYDHLLNALPFLFFHVFHYFLFFFILDLCF